MRRSALPHNATGALTPRCVVAGDHEKRRRQRVSFRVMFRNSRFAGYHCAASGVQPVECRDEAPLVLATVLG